MNSGQSLAATTLLNNYFALLLARGGLQIARGEVINFNEPIMFIVFILR